MTIVDGTIIRNLQTMRKKITNAFFTANEIVFNDEYFV